MSTGEYNLIVEDPAGVPQGEFSDYWSLVARKQRNKQGYVRFSCDAEHPILTKMQQFGQVVVMRRDVVAGLDWYEFTRALIRTEEYRKPDMETFYADLPDLFHLLTWRVNGYKPAVANRTLFTQQPLETIIKTLATRNWTSAGTTGDGRLRAATTAGKVNGYTLTVEANGGRGALLDRQNHGVQLLKEFQDCIEAAYLINPAQVGDIELVKTGATTYQLVYHPGQLGEDRTADVVFGVEQGNLISPVYAVDRTTEKTVGLVAGKGDKDAIKTRVVFGPDYVAGTNDIEVWINASNESTNEAIDARGAAELRKMRAKITFTYDIRQVQNSRFGVDFFLGDRVRAHYRAADFTPIVDAVTATKEKSGSEKLGIDLLVL